MQRPTKKSLMGLCEDFCRELALALAGYKCEYPGCKVKQPPNSLHPHHFWNRKYKSVKYCVMNIFILCAYHHKFGKEAAHNDPNWKGIALTLRHHDWYDVLIKQRNQLYKEDEAHLLKDLEMLTYIQHLLTSEPYGKGVIRDHSYNTRAMEILKYAESHGGTVCRPSSKQSKKQKYSKNKPEKTNGSS